MVQVQLFNVYAPKYDTGGKFWPIVHNTTIFSLVVLHIIAIGVFGLKKLPLASSLLLPLPVLTLLFNEFCRNRFVPIFEAYTTEVTVPICLQRLTSHAFVDLFALYQHWCLLDLCIIYQRLMSGDNCLTFSFHHHFCGYVMGMPSHLTFCTCSLW